MNVVPRGTAVMVPNSNGSFFSGASQIQLEGVVPQNTNLLVATVEIPTTPNLLIGLKGIIVGMFDDNTKGANEYNGTGETSENSSLQNLGLVQITGGQALANASILLDITGEDNMEIRVVNGEAAKELAYILFLTWTVVQMPFTVVGP